MDGKAVRAYCLSRRKAEETFPFGPETAVFKVGGKMFALMGTDGSPQVSLKCNPDWADTLRQSYAAVKPGYHLNKFHWNTVDASDPDIPDDLVRELIDHSYRLVVKGLTRKVREDVEG